jgi:hypothetical protein
LSATPIYIDDGRACRSSNAFARAGSTAVALLLIIDYLQLVRSTV